MFFLFALFYLPVFILKGKHRQGFWERFGRVPEEIRKKLKGKKVFWLHAVSVGEVVLAVRFANALKSCRPNGAILLTTTTMAGREVAEKLVEEDDALLYFPADFRFAVRAFIRSVSPAAVIILETEIWPNLTAELSRRRIPTFIVNGRISDKGIPAYRRIRFFLKPVLRRFAAIGVQDERMKARFLELGAELARVSVTGNLKYDWTPKAAADPSVLELQHRLRSDARLWLVAGSTHDHEEEMLFDCTRDLGVVIAPRHLERLSAIESKAAQKNIPTRRISSLARNGSSGVSPSEVLLLDQMGTLALWYAFADLVFVGGSLVPVGGHNLVEPAFFEKPILFGPFMENFREMGREFVQKNAAVQVRDEVDLRQKIKELLKDIEKRRNLGRAAKQLVLDHQGAVEKNLNLVLGGLEL